MYCLHFLAVVFTISSDLVLAFALARLAFALAFVLRSFSLARAGLAFAFVVRARPATCLVVLQVFGFLSTVPRHMPINCTT